MNTTKKVAYYGDFAALAQLMGYVEQLVPMPFPVPGMKLGLANVVVLIVLYYMGGKEAFQISVIRILMAGLLFSGFAGFLYSMSGAVLSFLIMVFLKKTGQFSIVGVSVAGGVGHNIGQLVCAAAVVSNIRLFYYLPALLIAGVATGILIGSIAGYCLQYLERKNFL